ncbi:MAG TPA: hypothetical protein VNN20_15135 [Thermodesulfobacteriota bacterium]|nr:hypothetical protein [Thermodesulfobacteriota bacterium]
MNREFRLKEKDAPPFFEVLSTGGFPAGGAKWNLLLFRMYMDR